METTSGESARDLSIVISAAGITVSLKKIKQGFDRGDCSGEASQKQRGCNEGLRLSDIPRLIPDLSPTYPRLIPDLSRETSPVKIK
ncbi:hypothetical protein CAL7716_053430 [Calothrix sp. PCC 7716]|nr:hypothetical protein CAL7716_053430 [Calothrix sp. PCC 7716]